MADVFFDARNALAVGNFHQAIAEASGAKPMTRAAAELEAFNTDKDAIIARGQIGLGQEDAVLAQLRTATNPVLVSVNRWATFCGAYKKGHSAAVEAAVQALVHDAEAVQPECAWRAVDATAALLKTEQFEAALLLAKRWLAEMPKPTKPREIRQEIQLRALVVEGLLAFNRPDVAAREVETIQGVDEEAVESLLAEGLVSLHQGQSSRDMQHCDHAINAFREVSMRCGQSVMVLNLLAVAQMAKGAFEDAEKTLLDALAVRSGDADTTANIAVVSAQLGKSPETVERYMQQAQALSGHWAKALEGTASEFDRAAAAFKASS